MKCGREPGGPNEPVLGTCPAALPGEHAGINRGRRRGRSCWLVAGTFCGGARQGSFAQKRSSCISCEFFLQVTTEEGGNFVLSPRPPALGL